MSFVSRKKTVPVNETSVEISTLVCEPLEKAGFLNAFSTRMNGVSAMPRQALNLSPKDEIPTIYEENKRRFLAAIDAADWNLVTAHQTHSDIRIDMTGRQGDGQTGRTGDALINNDPKILIGVKTADCLPVLIADPRTRVMAAVHAGWRGTLQWIFKKTIIDLKLSHGVNPADCLIAIGPAACGDCYEVGPELVASFRAEMKDADFFFKKRNTGKFYFDNTLAAKLQLGLVGVPVSQIFSANRCTIHENGFFFSHRLEGKEMPLVGRLLSVIGKPN